jgi:hypothetical protein
MVIRESRSSRLGAGLFFGAASVAALVFCGIVAMQQHELALFAAGILFAILPGFLAVDACVDSTLWADALTIGVNPGIGRRRSYPRHEVASILHATGYRGVPFLIFLRADRSLLFSTSDNFRRPDVDALAAYLGVPVSYDAANLARLTDPRLPIKWQNVLGYPGLGFLTVFAFGLLAMMGSDAISLVVTDRSYQSASVCVTPLDPGPCRLVGRGTIVHQYWQASTNPSYWVVTALPNGKSVETYLSPELWRTLYPSEAVSIEAFGGKVSLINGIRTSDYPGDQVGNGLALGLVGLLIFSGPAAFTTIALRKLLRQRQTDAPPTASAVA